MTPGSMTPGCMTALDRVLERLPHAKRNGRGWVALCPAHEDRHPSLSVDAGEDGRVLVHCHAGCPTRAVVEAMGLGMADLHDAPAPGSAPADSPRRRKRRGSGSGVKGLGEVVAVYRYITADGSPAFEVRRYEPKTFRPFGPDGSPGYPESMREGRPLYRLAELREAGDTSLVYVVEGEKDTDRVGAEGAVAVTCAGGAKAAGRSDWSPLAGRDVVLVPDHDDAGRAFADAVGRLLAGVASSVRVLELAEHWPGRGAMPEKGDVSDWLDAGGDVEDLWRAAEAARECEPGGAEEAATVDEGGRRKPKRDRGRSMPVLLCAADVEPAAVRWLWPGRIARGRMTLLVGRPSEGKSFLTAYLAACVSRGRNWTDGTRCPVGSVVLCSAEDDPADTIVPRLIAHGADLQRVHILTGQRWEDASDDDAERVFTLADLGPLRCALEQRPDCRLIVVDPIGSYLGGQADAHRDNEVRGVLAPACKLAAEHDAALLVVAHNRKSAAAYADDTAMGSRAFTGLARTVLHLMADPDDEDKRRRLLLPGGNNLAERAAGLAFDIGPGEVRDTEGEPRACIRWQEGTVDIGADEAVNREPSRSGGKRAERDAAGEWARQALAAGPRPTLDLFEEARQVEGIAEKTLRRAMKDIGAEAFRPENPGPWLWQMKSSGAHCHPPEGGEVGHVAMCPDDSVRGVSGAV